MTVRNIQQILSNLHCEQDTMKRVVAALDGAYGLLDDLRNSEACVISEGFRKEIERVMLLLEGAQ